jgi:Cupredoxin-like domain
MVSRPAILAIVVIAVLALSAAYYINSSSGGTGTATINMAVTDGTPQNGGPDQILPTNFTVTEGDHYTIVFDNTDDGPHEEVIPALGFTTGVVNGGVTARFAFTPDKVGTFGYYQPAGSCVSISDPAVSCTGPQDMNGTVIVVAP